MSSTGGSQNQAPVSTGNVSVSAGSLPQQQQQPRTMDPQQQLLALIALQMSQQQQQQQQSTNNALQQQLLSVLMSSMQASQQPLEQLQQPAPASTASHRPEKKKKASRKQDDSAAAVASFNNDMNALREAALKRGSKILACRARGMPDNHNEHTAFLEVPQYEPAADGTDDASDASTASQALHGLELVCSYPSCRNKGVKFLYCFYCGDAVSRRCFRSGHSHEAKAFCQRGRSQPGEAVRHRQKLMRQQEQQNEQREEDAARVVAAMLEQQKARLVLDPALGAELSATKAEWDALLDERQDMGSNDDTSDWLDRVFVVSRRYRSVTDRVNAARIV